MASGNPYTSFGQTATSAAAPPQGQTFETSTFGHPAPPDAHPANARAASAAPGAGAGGPSAAASPGKQHGDTAANLKASATDFGNKAKSIVGNVWGHLSTGHSTLHTTVGKLQNYRLLTPGSAQSFWREHFLPPPSDVFKTYYACHLSTSTGPVAGSLFVATQSFSFMSDRPLAYNTGPVNTSWSYYKVMLPLDRISNIAVPPGADKYVQVSTDDGHQFWFMGFISFDKAVQDLRQTRDVRPVPTDPGFHGAPYSSPQYQPAAPTPYTQSPPTPPPNQGPYSPGAASQPPQSEAPYRPPPGPYPGTPGPPGPYPTGGPSGPYQGTGGPPGQYGQAPQGQAQQGTLHPGSQGPPGAYGGPPGAYWGPPPPQT